VEFYANSNAIGSAKIGSDGNAGISWTPSVNESSTLTLSAVFSGSGCASSVAAPVKVQVFQRSGPNPI
jgi:hypothetical protein